MGRDPRSPAVKAVGSEPPSYVACLVADGDNMGRALDELAAARSTDPVAACRTFSERLLEFPDAAKRIVAEHLGAPVYAGGDDVLAFLPVATALDCAKLLANEFERVMNGTGVKPTLSVGIGVAHVVEAMGLLLELGREAERMAKQSGRNALAVLFDKRSGGRRKWSRQWCASEPPVERLRADAGKLGGELSSGKVYEASALLRRFPCPSDPAVSPGLAEALVAYSKQVFAQSGGDGMTPAGIMRLDLFPDTAPPWCYRETHQRLETGLQRLLLARDLARNGFGCRAGASGVTTP